MQVPCNKKRRRSQMKKKLTAILVYLAGAASVFALVLGRISAARACTFYFYQPKVPDCMKQED